jgi:hypothetical protein
MSKTLKAVIVILFILVFLSLSLNLYLYWQLLQAQQRAQALIPQVQQILAQAATDVESFHRLMLRSPFKRPWKFLFR